MKKFQIGLENYLQNNTELSNQEIFVASSFLSALTLTEVEQRFGVLKIMEKALVLMEEVLNGKSTIEDALNELDNKMLN